MTFRSKLLLLCPAAGLAALLYVANRQCKAITLLGDICTGMKENVAETHALHRTLRHQRGAINGIHRYLVPVTKGPSKHGS
jgi:hypothetical protein